MTKQQLVKEIKSYFRDYKKKADDWSNSDNINYLEDANYLLNEALKLLTGLW